MPKPGALHHLVLEAANLDQSEEFYRSVIELEACGRDVWPEDEPNSVFRTNGGQYIVLVQSSQVQAEGPEVHLQLYLTVERWHAVAARLKKLGYPMKDERKAGLRAIGELAVHVHDPDGHVLELNASEPRVYEVPPAGRGKVDAGRVADFPVGSVTRIPAAQTYLVHLADGFLALSQVCTHMQFTVTYQPEHHRFFCPRHRYRFGRTGACLQRPGRSDAPPLHTYAIEFVDDHVVIDTDVSHPRSPEEVDCPVRIPTLANG